jgi:hypothetical protein
MISANLEVVRGRVRQACTRSGRDPADVTLVAVAKTFPAGNLREAIAAGVTDIGENYVQELLAKREDLADVQVRWHFIGHLQSNKVRAIVPWVHLIHSVDNVPLAREIDRRAGMAGTIAEVLVEVNTTAEGTKFGVAPEEAPAFVESLKSFENLRLAGLMTIGPFLPDPEGSRPMFRTLRSLRDRIATSGQRNAPMQHLSMGMTGDFEVAIDEGATIIRVGTAIFGSRKQKES